MRAEVLTLALAVGALTWAFRYLPMRTALHAVKPDTMIGRFLAATGPAAIATLLVAELLPYLRGAMGGQLPLVAGISAVLVVFYWQRSVVPATLAGSAVYGLATFLTAT
jgi:branched-subunit amino acid transport protein